MIFPIGDFPNPRGFVPFFTWLLIAINLGVYFFITLPLSGQPPSPGPELQRYVEVMSEALAGQVDLQRFLTHLSAYDVLLFQYGFRPAAPSVSGLFTSMFLHANFVHLAGNMLFLWIYGNNVEHRLGRGRFVVAYVATGIAATAFHAVGAPHSSVPMVGASGAISGVLGFYFLFFPRNQVRLLWMFPPFLFRTFILPARVVLGFYLLLDNVLPYLLTSSDVGVAHGAHIGGFVAGVAWAWVRNRREVSATPQDYAHRHAPSPVAEDELREALAAGRYDEAAVSYFDRRPRDTSGLLSPEESIDFAAWLEQAGHAEAALTVLRRHARDFPNGPRLAEAFVAAGRILLRDLREPTAAYQNFLAALDLDPDPTLDVQARQGIAQIESMQKRRR